MTAQTLGVIIEESHHRSGKLFNIFTFLSIAIGVVAGTAVVYFGQPVVILLSVMGLVIFAGTVLSVEFGLLMLVFLAYTRLSDILVHNYAAPSVAKLFIPLLIVSILVRWVLNRDTPRGWERPAILLGIYGMVGFASLLYAPNPERVWSALVVYAKDSIIAVLVVILLQTPNTFKRVIWTLLMTGIFLGSLTIFQYVTDTFENNYWGFAAADIQSIAGGTNDYRSAGPIGDPNYYAQILVVLIPLALERVLHERHLLLRGLALWALIVTMFSVFLTYSRGGFLAMVAAVVTFFILYPPKVAYIPIAIFGGLFLMSLAPPRYFDRILSLSELFAPSGSLLVDDPALRGRASENLAALEMVKDHPIFGIGLSNFSFLFSHYSKQAGLALVSTERAAHNLYLEVVAETGVFGFAIFIIILGTSLRTIVRGWRVFIRTKSYDYAGITAGLGAGFIGYLVAAFFIHNAFPRYFYLLIGIAMSLELVARNHLQDLHGTRGAKAVSLLSDRESV